MDTQNKNSSNNFLWLAAGITIGVTIMLVLVSVFVIFYTQPVFSFHPAPTPVNVIVDYDGIAKKITSNDAAEKLCYSLYPIDPGKRDSKGYWEIKDDLFIVYVEIYPEVNIDGVASVKFTSLGAMINHKDGYQDPVTDPDEYNRYLQAALVKTNGNRGYMAHWIIPMIDGKPSNQLPLSGCTPIPYEK